MLSAVDRRRLASEQLAEGVRRLEEGAPALAQPALESAVSLAPEWAATHYHLAIAFARTNDAAAAERSCRAALDADPEYPWPMHHLGAILVQRDRLEEALVWLTRAAQRLPDQPVVRRDLGVAHLFLGNIVAAREHLLASLELDPLGEQVMQTLATLISPRDHPEQSARFDAVTNRLLAQTDGLTPAQLVDLCFAVGGWRDRNGEADAAFAAFAQGNALRRQLQPFDMAALEAHIARVTQVWDAALLGRLAGHGSASARPIFIVGMARSGTTLVEQIIAAHPQVQSGGETLAMPTVLNSARGPGGSTWPDWPAAMQPADCASIGEAYLAQLPAPPNGEPRFTDKRLENVEALGAISVCLPRAPMIWVNRDPRDSGWSCFSTNFLGGQAWSGDLGDIGRYWRALERLKAHWRAVLPPGRLLEVSYEALVADLKPWARRIVSHCGLAWDDACLDFHRSRQPVRSASVAQVRQPIYDRSVGRWRLYEAHLAPMLEVLGPI